MKIIICSLGLVAMIAFTTSSCKKCKCDEPQEKTLTTQPGPNNGQDCLVAFRATDGGLYASSNLNSNPDLAAARWTWDSEGAGEGTVRAYFKFPELSQIPAAATIKSAKLSLYGLTTGTAIIQGNSVYPGSPYSGFGSNKCWLKRVVGNWDEASITWNNKPATSDANQVEVPASTSQWNYNVTDLDVTLMVKDMILNSQNYGFVLQMQTEQIYRSLGFSSSESTDAAKRPKLVVVYEQ